MTTVYVWLGLAALVASLIAVTVWLAQRMGAAQAEKVVAEDVAKIQKAMAEADALKPSSGDELVERLRKAGL